MCYEIDKSYRWFRESDVHLCMLFADEEALSAGLYRLDRYDALSCALRLRDASGIRPALCRSLYEPGVEESHRVLERKQHGSMRPYTRSYLWPLIYFKGFYQSEKYFADIKDEVRQAFTFDLKQANGQSLRMREQIDKDEHAVSLHVRRGDYLQPKHWEAIGCICQLSYYRNALEEMGKRVERPRYYVFSDDLAWVKENLDLPDAVYIDWNKGEDSWQDMMLMSRCRHHIICNSTFSWWGAWLNPRNGKIVIAPERWTRDADSREIVPAEWLRVSIK